MCTKGLRDSLTFLFCFQCIGYDTSILEILFSYFNFEYDNNIQVNRFHNVSEGPPITFIIATYFITIIYYLRYACFESTAMLNLNIYTFNVESTARYSLFTYRPMRTLHISFIRSK